MKATEQNRNHEPTGTSIANAILEATNALRVAGVPDPRREANSLLAHVLGKDRTFIISHATDELDVLTLETYGELIRRRAVGEPQQYITGTQSFYGLEFLVTPDVLIPRPETELLVEAALKLMDESQNTELVLCDIGTGSGCIAITLVHLRPRSIAVAIDISERALAVAKSNAHRHAVSNRISFLAGDAFGPLEPDTKFDLILSNPPYVSAASLAGLQREVRDHEPLIALTPGSDGLVIIRRLINESPTYLKPGGFLLFEIGFDQHQAVHDSLDPRVWQLLEIQPDLQGIPRVVALQKLT
jgi:release factor glutamine methyltransferase